MNCSWIFNSRSGVNGNGMARLFTPDAAGLPITVLYREKEQ